MEKDLKKNLEYVEKNKEKLMELYAGKYLLVFNEEVVDIFDTYETAANEGLRQYGADGNFLVYHLVKNNPANFVMEAAF